jgi:hydroxyacylglutathione hydrolase
MGSLMKLIPLPALTDNYIWMLHDGENALVVDPGVAQPVLEALALEGLKLQGILITHHHGDHTGGVAELRQATGAQVFGPAKEQVPEPLVKLSQGNSAHLLGLEFQVIDVPGHTAGHIAFYCKAADGVPLLFCGDTLFSGGCGRLFEGTPAQMLSSLQTLAALPANTRVCCTHEYTLSNLKFAREVDPNNTELENYQQHCLTLRSKNLPTLPSSMALEMAINPFLRSTSPAVLASVERFDAEGFATNGSFATLRTWKNQYQ